MLGFNRNVDTIIPVVSPVVATGVLTSNNTNVSDADTVTIGTVVYRFKNTLAQIGDIKIGASADASLTSLANAINGVGTPGTDYFTGTPKDLNVSASAVASHALTMTALTLGNAANTTATTKSAVTLSWGDTTLNGGEGGAMTAYLFDTTTITTLAMNLESYFEAILFINIAAHAGTNPTMDCKIQYSPDNVNWVDSGDTITQITTSNAVSFKKLTASFGKYVRLVFTLGGTTPSYTADVKMLGKL